MSEVQDLYEAVQKAIDRIGQKTHISPAWVATQAMTIIRFPRSLHELGYIGCHLELRQIARGKLRVALDPTAKERAEEDAQLHLFSEYLQTWYPRKTEPDEEPEYVLLEHMTDEDVKFNQERMRKTGQALLAHADRLGKWHANRNAA